MNLKRLSTIFIFVGIAFFLLIGYLEVLPRYSQYKMKSSWKFSAPKNANSKSQKLLKVEKRGPDKNQLGILQIPKIKVEQVIIYDATQQNLAIGPSLIKGTAYPGTIGNSAIAGHRVSHGFPFRNIHLLKRGDEVIFKNTSGKFIYKVDRQFRVLPSNLSVLKQTKEPRLTLLACDPPFSAKYRLAVIAVAKDYEK